MVRRRKSTVVSRIANPSEMRTQVPTPARIHARSPLVGYAASILD